MGFGRRDVVVWIAIATVVTISLVFASPRVVPVVVIGGCWLITLHAAARRKHDNDLTCVLCVGPGMVLLFVLVSEGIYRFRFATSHVPPISGTLLDDTLVEVAQIFAIGMIASLMIAGAYVLGAFCRPSPDKSEGIGHKRTGDLVK